MGEDISIMQPRNKQHSYSSALTQQAAFKTLSKEQAIKQFFSLLLKALKYMTVAIGWLVQPKNIMYAARISNKRICIYLSTPELVNDLIHSHKSIKIQEHDIEIRRLITPPQRLVISNVCPSIPNNKIECLVKDQGLKLMSRITPLRVGMPEAEYSHIISFRRLVFIAPPTEAIPDSLIITSDGTTYRIFLSTDSLKCTQCNKLGHSQLQCPENTEITTNHHTESNTTPATSNPTDSVTVTQSTDPTLASQEKVTDLPALSTKQQTKRHEKSAG
nr:unnamed protein product [Callosobruchus analis]